MSRSPSLVFAENLSRLRVDLADESDGLIGIELAILSKTDLSIRVGYLSAVSAFNRPPKRFNSPNLITAHIKRNDIPALQWIV